jgi:hypothetical protein
VAEESGDVASSVELDLILRGRIGIDAELVESSECTRN